MKLLLNLLSKKYGELLYGLIFGFSFFMIALKFIVANTYNGGLLLAGFLSPVIICVPALFFVKSVKMWKEADNMRAIKTFLIFIIFLLLVSLLFLADFITNGIM